MQINIAPSKDEMGRRAAEAGAELIRAALDRQDEVAIILATGASQFEMLAHLTAQKLDWNRITAFHLDEYVGLSASHPASFRRYLKERFVEKLPTGPRSFHFLNVEQHAEREARRIGTILAQYEVEVAFVGIGENGHLAFNDPPADFGTEEPFLLVELDEACRLQQVGEGWFGSIDEVPRHAVSMSVRQIMKARHIICTVPDLRKATAVMNTIEGPVTQQVPASILRRHPDCRIFLDVHSASKLHQGS